MKAYAIFDFKGKLMINTIRHDESYCISCYEKRHMVWDELVANGYSCKKVLVTPPNKEQTK